MISTVEIKIPATASNHTNKIDLIIVIEVRTGDNKTHTWMTANTDVFNQIAIAARKGVDRYIEESK